jgi:peroxiredoxin
MGSEIIGISTDSTWSHAAYRASLKLRFPLVSDYNREVIGDLVGFYEDLGGLKGVNKRGAVVVDPALRLRWRWVTEDPGEVPDTEAVREAVQEVTYE